MIEGALPEIPVKTSSPNQIPHEHPCRQNVRLYQRARPTNTPRQEQDTASDSRRCGTIKPPHQCTEIGPAVVVLMSDMIPDVPHICKEGTIVENDTNTVVVRIDNVLNSSSDASAIVPIGY